MHFQNQILSIQNLIYESKQGLINFPALPFIAKLLWSPFLQISDHCFNLFHYSHFKYSLLMSTIPTAITIIIIMHSNLLIIYSYRFVSS